MAQILGTSGNDTLNGTAGGDEIYGGDGIDLLQGLGGNDYVDGGKGDDDLRGGAGDDVYIVDHLGDITKSFLDAGTDVVGAFISYSLGTAQENLTLLGTAKIDGAGNALNNQLTGNSNSNVLKGFNGNDLLDGKAGDDNLQGGNGNDNYVVDHLGDIDKVIADAGLDAVYSFVSYALGAQQENLFLQGTQNLNGTGNLGNNSVVGNSGANVLNGSGGNDLLNGLAGNDTLIGGLGNDQLEGGSGADSLRGDAGNDTYIIDRATEIDKNLADAGIDLVATSLSYALGANQEDVVLTGVGVINATGNIADNRLFGNSASNKLYGGAGNDLLNGQGGDDDLRGQLGDDIYVIDHLSDIDLSVLDPGTDEVQSVLNNYTLGANQERLRLLGTANISGSGNGQKNLLIGNDGVNILRGLDGDDTLDGGLGNDELYGGNGADTYYVDNAGDVASGTDLGVDTVISLLASFTLGTHQETLQLGNGATILNGTGNGADNTLYGNSNANTLSGEAGNDYLDGGPGRDLLKGGAGNDTYVIDHLLDIDKSVVDLDVDDVFVQLNGYTLGLQQENLWLMVGANILTGTGNSQDNRIRGNGNSNLLLGLDGKDDLDGLGGDDDLRGGNGDDKYTVDHHNDIDPLIADPDSDTVDAKLDAYILGPEQENLQLLTGAGIITGTGNSKNNQLFGNSNNNVLIGLDGDDVLNGFTGADDMRGGNNDDIYYVDNLNDINASIVDPGKDTVWAFVDNYALKPGQEVLRLGNAPGVVRGNGNTLDNELHGNANGGNILSGGGGNDILDGGAGDDSLRGEDGNDTYIIDHIDDIDKTNLEVDGGIDTVRSTVTYSLSIQQENLELLGTGTISGTGNTGNNFLTGNSGANTLNGDGGDDEIDGGGGIDQLFGGAGDDRFVYDALDTLVDGGAASDTLQLDGTNVHLDLTAIPDNRLINLEFIEFIGTNNNSLTFSLSDLIALSSSSDDVLVVNGSTGNEVTSSGQGWAIDPNGPATINGQDYHRYTNGTAQLYVDTDITQTIS